MGNYTSVMTSNDAPCWIFSTESPERTADLETSSGVIDDEADAGANPHFEYCDNIGGLKRFRHKKRRSWYRVR